MTLKERLRRAQSDKFVGREAQLDLFKDNISSKVPTYPFLQISGQGGVGKTTLLGRFQELCNLHDIPHAVTNEEQKTVPQVMHRFAELFTRSGHVLKSFTERYQTYLQLQEKIEKEPDRPDILRQFFSQAAGKSTVVASRATSLTSILVDLVGPEEVERQVNALSSYLFQKLKKKGDVQLILDPTSELSPLFVSDLNKIAKRQQLVLMFDTFEDTNFVLFPWLKKLIIEEEYGSVSEYISFVFAARSFDSHNWLDWQPLLQQCNLEPFTIEETKIYLKNQGVTDPATINQIHHLSGGLPLFVAMLVAPSITDAGQATRIVVERFLRNIEDPTRRQIALHLALARRFDQDLLIALLPDKPDSQVVAELFTWIADMPFVQTRDGYWIYHSLVRAQMVAFQRHQSKNEFEQIHQTLADYYLQQAKKYGYQTPNQWQNHASWWPDYLEITYHTLCDNPEKKLPETKIELAEILSYIEFGDQVTLNWAETLTQASIDLDKHSLVSEWAKLVEATLAAPFSKEISFEEADNFFELFDTLCQIIDEDKMPSIAAKMYLNRGITHDVRGDYESALEDYSKAIQLNPEFSNAYYNRGVTYNNQSKNEQAIADYSEAIRLNPEYSNAYHNRGITHYLQDDYEQAIADYNETIRLSPEFADAYYNRGIAYYKQNNYNKAIADYSEAIRLYPEYANAYYNRGIIYYMQGDYEQAIANFNEVVTLNQANAGLYYNLARAYALQKNTEAMSMSLRSALELNPTPFLALISTDPDFGLVRDDPEFQDLLTEFLDQGLD